MNYLEIKTKESTGDVLLKVMNIQQCLTLVEWNKKIKDTLFRLMKNTFDKDFVIIKKEGLFTKEQLSIAQYYNFNGHTISFIDTKWVKYHKTGLLGLLDTIATIRSKGHYIRRNKKIQR